MLVIQWEIPLKCNNLNPCDSKWIARVRFIDFPLEDSLWVLEKPRAFYIDMCVSVFLVHQ